MPDKNYQLQQVQIGKESTWGTAVTQTRELSVTSFELQPEQEIKKRRSLSKRTPTKANIIKTGGSATSEHDATYGEAAVIFDSLFGTATPSGAGPYTRTYAAPEGSNPARSFYTLALGDSNNVKSLLGGLASKLVISASPSDGVKFAVDWVGKVIADDTLDSVAADTNHVDILPQHLAISLGSLGGSLTALGCDAISAELEIDTATTVRNGLGSVSGCDHNYGNELSIKLTVTATGDNAVIEPLYEAHLGSTPSVSYQDVQVQFTESANNDLLLQMPMFLDEPPVLFEDEDGVAAVTLVFMAFTDNSGTTSFTSACDVTIINQEATLP